MGTHFIGNKNKEKLSKKLGIMFTKGYIYGIWHNKPKNYKVYLLSDYENNSYALLILQNAKNEARIYKLRKMPKDFNILSDDCKIDIDYQNDDIFLRIMPVCVDITQYIKERSIYEGIING